MRRSAAVLLYCCSSWFVASAGEHTLQQRIDATEAAIELATSEFEAAKRLKEQNQPLAFETERKVVEHLAELHYDAALAWRDHTTTDRIKVMHHLSKVCLLFS